MKDILLRRTKHLFMLEHCWYTASAHHCSDPVPCPELICRWHIIYQRAREVHVFPHLHPKHAGFDTFIVSRALAAPWPASQWLRLYYPYASLRSDSAEYHPRAHFSPNSCDNAGEPLQFYLSCLLLTKNSLAWPRNYGLISAVEHITDFLLLLLVRLSRYWSLTLEVYSMYWREWEQSISSIRQLSACLA